MNRKLKKLAEKYQHPEGNDVYEALVIAYNRAIDDALELYYNPTSEEDQDTFDKDLESLRMV